MLKILGYPSRGSRRNLISGWSLSATSGQPAMRRDKRILSVDPRPRFARLLRHQRFTVSWVIARLKERSSPGEIRRRLRAVLTAIFGRFRSLESEMNITISIDQNAVSLVLDGAERRPLGTGFSLIRPNWIVTAKHVALKDGLSRTQLLIGPSNSQPSIPARLLYAHPQVDLAVLEIDKHLCDRPLYPAHHSLAGSRGLICAGFAPSKSTSEAGTVLVNHIPSFTVEVRERRSLKEELVVFDAPYSEGGYSGGPIFGEGGGVVGVIIQNYSENGTLRARGTSLAPLISELRFPAPDSTYQ